MGINIVTLYKNNINLTDYVDLYMESIHQTVRLYNVLYSDHLNYGSANYKLYVPYCKKIVDTNDEFVRFQVDSNTFLSASELNQMREENLLVNRDECYNALSEYLFRM